MKSLLIPLSLILILAQLPFGPQPPEKPEEELTKTQIAQKAGIGRTTLYRVWEELEKMRALSASRQVGAVTLYRLNLESSTVQSVLTIKRRLAGLRTAVERIE
jgi:DNA-binding IclR family transcriptional regulator